MSVPLCIFYKIKFYKAALCSDDPYKGSADPIFESCIDILSSEKEVILQPNVDTNLLDGEDLVLPVGSYSYFTVVVNNHLNFGFCFDKLNFLFIVSMILKPTLCRLFSLSGVGLPNPTNKSINK